jgi:A/G-specific adenine glycosylase
MEQTVDWVRRLIGWYDGNKRALPWRESKDPYAVWISEIMLQQTRVDTVLEYYRRFMERFPTVALLAQASLDEVLGIWAGLGYYSRARNLHRAAGEILERYRGRFPDDYEEVLSLPGIGKYTAGAILSIAFDRACPAVEGNVLRVMSRLFLLEKDIALQETKGEVETIVGALFPAGRASDFTQGLMELGALICLPASPQCGRCPVSLECKAFQVNRQLELPVKTKKPERKAVKRYVAIVERDGTVLMNKRPEQGLLGGMWEFPGVEGKSKRCLNADFTKEYGVEIVPLERWLEARHVFTHLTWNLIVYRCKNLSSLVPEKESLQWVSLPELVSLPLPSAFKKIKAKLVEERIEKRGAVEIR